METLERPPALDVDMGGAPNLSGLEAPGDTIAAQDPTVGLGQPGPWTPEVMRVLMQGLFSMVAAWRGPHWAYPEVEADPLLEPTAEVFNSTPGLRNLSPNHVAIATVVMGWGAIAGKRLTWDRQIAAQKAEEAKARSDRMDSSYVEQTGSPYGPNRLG